MPPRIPVLLSACLLGVPCRYDGGSCPHPEALDLLRQGTALPVCPEQLGGLPTPRTPCERVGQRVLGKDGQDVTQAFLRGARIALQLAREAGCQEALLKALSPSCGWGRIYDGTFQGRLVQGKGVLAELLLAEGFLVRVAG